MDCKGPLPSVAPAQSWHGLLMRGASKLLKRRLQCLQPLGSKFQCVSLKDPFISKPLGLYSLVCEQPLRQARINNHIKVPDI